ncbi:hypothetical protein [Pseudomonas sp. Pseu.R1]|uniref:hypothetical protein n=1 Tax=Pseudomonas sp. Pseu.R1 TaxID=3379818 RepID=UPI003B93612A
MSLCSAILNLRYIEPAFVYNRTIAHAPVYVAADSILCGRFYVDWSTAFATKAAPTKIAPNPNLQFDAEFVGAGLLANAVSQATSS